MIYKLGRNSKANLKTCNIHAQGAIYYVLQFIDVGVAEGHRPKSRQNKLYEQSRTKLHWPDSEHNSMPSDAVDLVVYVKGLGYIDEKTAPEKYRQYYGYLAGLLETYCYENNLHFRWGGSWSGSMNFNEATQTFDDLVHFEIRAKKGKK